MRTQILGTEYEIITDKASMDDFGYIDNTTKKIFISSDMLKDNSRELKDLIMRHEIIHAYLYEGGLLDYNDDETLVNWLAIQIPKLQETFWEIGV